MEARLEKHYGVKELLTRSRNIAHIENSEKNEEGLLLHTL
jgi:hypothetical protein